MSEGSGEIIIKGGSVELSFDDGVYQKGSVGTYKHPDRKITRVIVEDESGNMKLDSGESDGLRWTITVSTR